MAAGTATGALSELADLLLEQRPGLLAELLAPFLVEAGAAQPIAEACRLGDIALEPLGLQPALQRRVELRDILALAQRGLVEVPRHDLLQLGRQGLPGGGVAADP